MSRTTKTVELIDGTIKIIEGIIDVDGVFIPDNFSAMANFHKVTIGNTIFEIADPAIADILRQFEYRLQNTKMHSPPVRAILEMAKDRINQGKLKIYIVHNHPTGFTGGVASPTAKGVSEILMCAADQEYLLPNLLHEMSHVVLPAGQYEHYLKQGLKDKQFSRKLRAALCTDFWACKKAGLPNSRQAPLIRSLLFKESHKRIYRAKFRCAEYLAHGSNAFLANHRIFKQMAPKTYDVMVDYIKGQAKAQHIATLSKHKLPGASPARASLTLNPGHSSRPPAPAYKPHGTVIKPSKAVKWGMGAIKGILNGIILEVANNIRDIPADTHTEDSQALWDFMSCWDISPEAADILMSEHAGGVRQPRNFVAASTTLTTQIAEIFGKCSDACDKVLEIFGSAWMAGRVFKSPIKWDVDMVNDLLLGEDFSPELQAQMESQLQQDQQGQQKFVDACIDGLNNVAALALLPMNVILDINRRCEAAAGGPIFGRYQPGVGLVPNMGIQPSVETPASNLESNLPNIQVTLPSAESMIHFCSELPDYLSASKPVAKNAPGNGFSIDVRIPAEYHDVISSMAKGADAAARLNAALEEHKVTEGASGVSESQDPLPTQGGVRIPDGSVLPFFIPPPKVAPDALIDRFHIDDSIANGIGIAAGLTAGSAIGLAILEDGSLMVSVAFTGAQSFAAIAGGLVAGAAVAGIILGVHYLYEKHLQSIHKSLVKSIQYSNRDSKHLERLAQEFHEKFEHIKTIDDVGQLANLAHNNGVFFRSKIPELLKRAKKARRSGNQDLADSLCAIARSFWHENANAFFVKKSLKVIQHQHDFTEHNADNSIADLVNMAKERASDDTMTAEKFAEIQGLKQLCLGKIVQLVADGEVAQAQQHIEQLATIKYYEFIEIETLTTMEGVDNKGNDTNFGFGNLDKNTRGDIKTINDEITKANQLMAAGQFHVALEIIRGLIHHCKGIKDETWHKRGKKAGKKETLSSDDMSPKQWEAAKEELAIKIGELEGIEEKLSGGCEDIAFINQEEQAALDELLSVEGSNRFQPADSNPEPDCNPHDADTAATRNGKDEDDASSDAADQKTVTHEEKVVKAILVKISNLFFGKSFPDNFAEVVATLAAEYPDIIEAALEAFDFIKSHRDKGFEFWKDAKFKEHSPIAYQFLMIHQNALYCEEANRLKSLGNISAAVKLLQTKKEELPEVYEDYKLDEELRDLGYIAKPLRNMLWDLIMGNSPYSCQQMLRGASKVCNAIELVMPNAQDIALKAAYQYLSGGDLAPIQRHIASSFQSLKGSLSDPLANNARGARTCAQIGLFVLDCIPFEEMELMSPETVRMMRTITKRASKGLEVISVIELLHKALTESEYALAPAAYGRAANLARTTFRDFQQEWAMEIGQASEDFYYYWWLMIESLVFEKFANVATIFYNVPIPELAATFAAIDISSAVYHAMCEASTIDCHRLVLNAAMNNYNVIQDQIKNMVKNPKNSAVLEKYVKKCNLLFTLDREIDLGWRENVESGAMIIISLNEGIYHVHFRDVYGCYKKGLLNPSAEIIQRFELLTPTRKHFTLFASDITNPQFEFFYATVVNEVAHTIAVHYQSSSMASVENALESFGGLRYDSSHEPLANRARVMHFYHAVITASDPDTVKSLTDPVNIDGQCYMSDRHRIPFNLVWNALFNRFRIWSAKKENLAGFHSDYNNVMQVLAECDIQSSEIQDYFKDIISLIVKSSLSKAISSAEDARIYLANIENDYAFLSESSEALLSDYERVLLAIVYHNLHETDKCERALTCVSDDIKALRFDQRATALAADLKRIGTVKATEVLAKLCLVSQTSHARAYELNGQYYAKERIVGDGDCLLTAYDITRAATHELLIDNLDDPMVQYFLGQLILEQLIENLAVFDGLHSDFLQDQLLWHLDQVNMLRMQGRVSQIQAEQAEQDLLTAICSNQDFLRDYVNYDVRDRQIEDGYLSSHIVYAIAHIQNVRVRIFRIIDGQLQGQPSRYPEGQTPPNSDDVRTLLYDGLIHYDRLRLATAAEQQHVEILARIPRNRQNNADAWHRQGGEFYNQREWHKAQYCWEYASKLHSNRSSTHFNLGLLYYNGYIGEQSRRLTHAKNCFLRACSLDPATLSNHRLLCKTELYILDWTVNLNNSYLLARRHHAGSHGYQKDCDRAYYYYQYILNEDPNHVGARKNLAKIYFDRGDEASLEAAIDHYLMLDINDESIRLPLLSCQLRADGYDTENATHWLKLAEDYFRGRERTSASGQRARIVEINYQNARLCYKEVLRINPRNGVANINLGYIYQYGLDTGLTTFREDLRQAIYFFEMAQHESPQLAERNLTDANGYLYMNPEVPRESVGGFLSALPGLVWHRVTVLPRSLVDTRHLGFTSLAEQKTVDLQLQTASRIRANSICFFRGPRSETSTNQSQHQTSAFGNG